MRWAAFIATSAVLAAALDAQSPATVASRVAELTAASAETRALAACHLGALRRAAEPAVTALSALLADATPLSPVWCSEDRAGTAVADWQSTPGLEAARALASLGNAGTDALLAGVASRNPAVRRHALQGLLHVRPRSLRTAPVTELLLGLLADQDPVVRASAVRLLGRIQRPR